MKIFKSGRASWVVCLRAGFGLMRGACRGELDLGSGDGRGIGRTPRRPRPRGRTSRCPRSLNRRGTEAGESDGEKSDETESSRAEPSPADPDEAAPDTTPSGAPLPRAAVPPKAATGKTTSRAPVRPRTRWWLKPLHKSSCGKSLTAWKGNTKTERIGKTTRIVKGLKFKGSGLNVKVQPRTKEVTTAVADVSRGLDRSRSATAVPWKLAQHGLRPHRLRWILPRRSTARRAWSAGGRDQNLNFSADADLLGRGRSRLRGGLQIRAGRLPGGSEIEPRIVGVQ